jgi:hypothetical protein
MSLRIRYLAAVCALACGGGDTPTATDDDTAPDEVVAPEAFDEMAEFLLEDFEEGRALRAAVPTLPAMIEIFYQENTLAGEPVVLIDHLGQADYLSLMDIDSDQPLSDYEDLAVAGVVGWSGEAERLVPGEEWTDASGSLDGLLSGADDGWEATVDGWRVWGRRVDAETGPTLLFVRVHPTDAVLPNPYSPTEPLPPQVTVFVFDPLAAGTERRLMVAHSRMWPEMDFFGEPEGPYAHDVDTTWREVSGGM